MVLNCLMTLFMILLGIKMYVNNKDKWQRTTSTSHEYIMRQIKRKWQEPILLATDPGLKQSVRRDSFQISANYKGRCNVSTHLFIVCAHHRCHKNKKQT